MRLFVLLGVDVALILVATPLGFVLRGNFDVTQTEFVAFLTLSLRDRTCVGHFHFGCRSEQVHMAIQQYT